MAQALVDHIAGEVLGQAASFQYCFVDRLAIEVLGKFQFGTIDIDHQASECLGQTPLYSVTQITHVIGEVVGQWPGF